MHLRSWCLCLSLLALLFVGFWSDPACAEPAEHLCTVTDVINSGGYTYIGCREGDREVWLALPEISIPIGESISFPDTPPLVNFRSKSLDRAFDRIHFVSGITRLGSDGRNLIPRDTTFSGTDDNGTEVFSDDPAKVPGRQQPTKTGKAVHKRTGND